MCERERERDREKREWSEMWRNGEINFLPFLLFLALSPLVNFTNIFRYVYLISSIKNVDICNFLRLGVNFTNVLRAHLRKYSFAKKISTFKCKFKKILRKTFVKKLRIKYWWNWRLHSRSLPIWHDYNNKQNKVRFQSKNLQKKSFIFCFANVKDLEMDVEVIF